MAAPAEEPLHDFALVPYPERDQQPLGGLLFAGDVVRAALMHPASNLLIEERAHHEIALAALLVAPHLEISVSLEGG